MSLYDSAIGDVTDASVFTRMKTQGAVSATGNVITVGTGVITVPAATDTMACLGTAETFTALQTFSGGISVASPLVAVAGTHGQSLAVQVLEELTTIAAAATSTTTIQIPAGAIVLAVATRVTVAIPTATSFTVGDGSTAAKFNTGSNIPVTVNSTDPGTKAGPVYYAAATSIVYTPSTTPGAATGRVRTSIFYILVTPPTS